ncbi:hypothetical protein JD79_04393 [Geodermatophilus normandii]|uniref:Alpha/beta hydrolase family protein n=1 Tax=Geodermatophilus normandii TaxID=1137989 RepID=A0A317QSS8_9ACTN|nr:hypothetical protein [Geodermatophilus normandii]PWW25195.1 hypothetical protein JD79_04393 [Geodermatophilus normandii]
MSAGEIDVIRAGVFVGVDRTGDLQRLNDAAAGAHRMHAWALLQGLTDESFAKPIPETDVRFPFYGDTLYDLVDGRSAHAAADIVVRGDGADDDEQRFTRAVLEIWQHAGISDTQLAEAAGQDVVERGPQNWEWFQAILRAVDRFVQHKSVTSIALITRDVYQYLKNPAIREDIDSGVGGASADGAETVVVAHSLGTVMAYNLLRQRGDQRGWQIPLLVTRGSPLAVTEIRKTTHSSLPLRCPSVVSRWFNAQDERDVVALHPSTPHIFRSIPPRRRSRTSGTCGTGRVIGTESAVTSTMRKSPSGSTTPWSPQRSPAQHREGRGGTDAGHRQPRF